MRLMQELNENVDYLIEGESHNKSYYISGVFMQAETPNRNGRFYPRPVMESAVSKYQQEHIITKRALGELGHPSSPSIGLDRVSHIIESLDWKGNDIFGRAKILDTPIGKIAKSLIDEGVKLGVSSRAMGTLKRMSSGLNEVQNDLRLATVDIVADPSAPGAFVQGLMENADWILDAVSGNWVAQQFVEDTQHTFHQSTLTQISENEIKAFAKFLDTLKS